MKRLRWAPSVFLSLAALSAGGLFVCHALGWRTYTCVLSGSLPAGVTEQQAILCGVLYALAYFAAVVAAPILAIAAGLLLLVRSTLHRKAAGAGQTRS